MRVAVIILTRDRPLGIATVLGALSTFESGLNQVQYVVWCDEDDALTASTLATMKFQLGDKLTVLKRPRLPTIGTGLNACAATVDWDALVHLVDDTVPVCIGWDAAVARELERHPIVAWQELTDPKNVGLKVMSRSWYDAIGYVEPEWFLYWFGDTWVNEIYYFVTGQTIPISGELVTYDGGRRGKTTGMHDVGFWFDFFAKTRGVRVYEAIQVSDRLGLKMPQPTEALEKMAAWDAWQQRRIELYETMFGPPPNSELPERYFRARGRAEAYLLSL